MLSQRGAIYAYIANWQGEMRMEATGKRKRKLRQRPVSVPSYLIYEKMDGKPVYYSNFSSDVIIYERSQFADGPVTRKYSERPPRVIFEIDIQGDFDTPEEAINYYHKKTQQLLDFGVQQLFWFFTDTRKVVIAEPDKPWLTVDWSEELTVLGQYRFSFRGLIEASGLPFVLGGE